MEDVYDELKNAAKERQAEREAPVKEAQKNLASTRAGAVKGLDEFSKTVDEVQPRYQKAQASLVDIAGALGGCPYELQGKLKECFEFMQWGKNNFEHIIHAIDNLSDFDLHNCLPRDLLGMLNSAMNNRRGLEGLIDKIEDQIKVYNKHISGREQPVATE